MASDLAYTPGHIQGHTPGHARAPLRKTIALVACLVAGATLASPAAAQSLSVDLGGDGSLSLRAVQLFALLTLLSLVPGLAMMLTCFPFMVTVLSILRQAIGVQQAPPNMMIVSLALFLTWFVMEPVLTLAWQTGISPLIEGQITAEAAFDATMIPFREFMTNRVSPGTFALMRDAAPAGATLSTDIAIAEAPLSILVPSFLLSEIQRGFEIGFLIFVPFLIIDLIIAAVLMSMGMMMVPPAVVALPFKLAFFVIADGWSLIAGALVRSYA